MENIWQEFFNEFGVLLNKYNFLISEFTLGVSIDNRIKLVSFKSDGKKVYPEYSIPKDILSPEDKTLHNTNLDNSANV